MKQVPQVFLADQLRTYECDVKIDGNYVAARPYSIGGVLTRLKLAYGVFTGKYDALKWIKQ